MGTAVALAVADYANIAVTLGGRAAIEAVVWDLSIGALSHGMLRGLSKALPAGVGKNANDVVDIVVVPKGGGKIPWESWQNYPKVTQGGRTYAKVGDRLYTQHAVDRLQPSGFFAPAGQLGAGRSISPTFVDDVIRNGEKSTVMIDGVERAIHTSGSVQVVTEGNIVITVNPWGAR